MVVKHRRRHSAVLRLLVQPSPDVEAPLQHHVMQRSQVHRRFDSFCDSRILSMPQMPQMHFCQPVSAFAWRVKDLKTLLPRAAHSFQAAGPDAHTSTLGTWDVLRRLKNSAPSFKRRKRTRRLPRYSQMQNKMWADVCGDLHSCGSSCAEGLRKFWSAGVMVRSLLAGHTKADWARC